ncbi:MAG: HAD domain-containing protein [Firmicutes bacterium]|nr:HAD domain-containing protein [Bacillota bacterium]
MNLIFLDVDGVLNSHDYCNYYYRNYSFGTEPIFMGREFDQRAMHYLKTIVEATQSKLVISSNWRKSVKFMKYLVGELAKHNLFDDIIGVTPILANQNRGQEITQYIESVPHPTEKFKNVLILDDNNDMGNLEPLLLKTNARSGLTKENAMEAIRRLAPQNLSLDVFNKLNAPEIEKLNYDVLQSISEQTKEQILRKQLRKVIEQQFDAGYKNQSQETVSLQSKV